MPTEEQIKTIGEIVRKIEVDYIRGNTIISKYVNFSMYDTLEKIEAYLNSVHISGPKDSKGRKKPFFNIVTSVCNIWFRATDIDRKNIKIRPTQASDVTMTFVASLYLQQWMRKEKFGEFLNSWGRILSRFGSAVPKFVENSDGLHATVEPWNTLIIDSVDFGPNPVIKILELTESQLRKSKYDPDQVNALIAANKPRETIDHRRKDNKQGYYKLYEVHGDFQVALLKKSQSKPFTVADTKTFSRQMYVYSYIGGKSVQDKEIQDFILYSGEEAKNPFMITHLLEEDGRSLSIGPVELLFEAQHMVNHAEKANKDNLDITSKIWFQTDDGNFLGQNITTDVDNGAILIHDTGKPLTQVSNNATNLSALQNFATMWMNLAKDLTSTPDALRGATQPAGTAFRLQQLITTESSSLFELMTQNKGLYVEDMLRQYILPFIKKKLNHKEEIVAVLDANGIQKLDAMFVPHEATRRMNQKIVQDILAGKTPSPMDQATGIQAETQKIQANLSQSGNTRFIKPSDIDDKTWKDVFKDLEWDVEVDVTGEEKDNDAALTTLTNVLQTVAGNPAILQDPMMRKIFNKIMEIAGNISPLELSDIPQPQPQQTQPAPQQTQPQPLPANVGAGAGGQ